MRPGDPVTITIGAGSFPEVKTGLLVNFTEEWSDGAGHLQTLELRPMPSERKGSKKKASAKVVTRTERRPVTFYDDDEWDDDMPTDSAVDRAINEEEPMFEVETILNPKTKSVDIHVRDAGTEDYYTSGNLAGKTTTRKPGEEMPVFVSYPVELAFPLGVALVQERNRD